MTKPVAFVAYSSQPSQVGASIEGAVELYNRSNLPFLAESWRQIDIPGRFIVRRILEKIQAAPFVVADLTRLNFYVTFEVGYAMGQEKRVVLVLNRAIEPETKDITQLGVFDTLGHREYTNAQELLSILENVMQTSPLRFPAIDLDRSAPIYLLDTLIKTDAALRIVSRIKKSRLQFRSFDPKEQPRLATSEAMRNVKASIAVIVNLL
jgi:nucleoside 2-deoxyribosyltransferase